MTTRNMITGKNYIGNNLSSKGTKQYNTFNPQLNIKNEHVFTEATPEEIDEAVALATSAFKVFRSISKEKKAIFLNTIADEILALDDLLIKPIVQNLDYLKAERKENEVEQ